jgi:uncharacterized protein
MHPSSIPATASAADADAAAPRPAPASGKARIVDVDVIRALALLGVLLANLDNAFRVPIAFDGPPPAPPHGLERVVGAVLGIVIRGKAFSLFSILFGTGLAIFLERASASRPRPLLLLARRLVVLLGFGVAHMLLLWNGDILSSYAIAGLLALGFLRRRPVVLWIGFAFSVISVPVALWLLTRHAGAAGADHAHATRHAVADTVRVYGTGSYLEIVAFRVREMRQVYFGSPFFVLSLLREHGNMLLGILLWRSGIFGRVVAWRRGLRWAVGIGLVVGAAFPIYRQVRLLLDGVPPTARPHPGLVVASSLSMLMLALAYAAGILLLLQRPRWRARLLRLAPAGRMAFTNYLMQSLVFSTVFYGYGLGLLGKLSGARTMAIGVAFYVLQVVMSALWLRRFRFGPLEWAWRSLTYGQRQPLRRR